MEGSKFLKLTPEEGRQYVPESAFITPAKLEGQSQSLRRVASVANLKTKANKDGAGCGFLKLTPDPATNTGTATSGSHDRTKESIMRDDTEGDPEEKGNETTCSEEAPIETVVD